MLCQVLQPLLINNFKEMFVVLLKLERNNLCFTKEEALVMSLYIDCKLHIPAMLDERRSTIQHYDMSLYIHHKPLIKAMLDDIFIFYILQQMNCKLWNNKLSLATYDHSFVISSKCQLNCALSCINNKPWRPIFGMFFWTGLVEYNL